MPFGRLFERHQPHQVHRDLHLLRGDHVVRRRTVRAARGRDGRSVRVGERRRVERVGRRVERTLVTRGVQFALAPTRKWLLPLAIAPIPQPAALGKFRPVGRPDTLNWMWFVVLV